MYIIPTCMIIVDQQIWVFHEKNDQWKLMTVMVEVDIIV